MAVLEGFTATRGAPVRLLAPRVEGEGGGVVGWDCLRPTCIAPPLGPPYPSKRPAEQTGLSL